MAAAERRRADGGGRFHGRIPVDGRDIERDSESAVAARTAVFRVEGVVDAPRRVYFHVLNARGHEGQRYAPVKGNAFILEPGQLRVDDAAPRTISH